MDFEEFKDRISEAIENALIIDDEGDYTFDIEHATDNVIDALEKMGVVQSSSLN